ncbi:hypothetical protein ScPMuIL_000316 [Solemya velum]
MSASTNKFFKVVLKILIVFSISSLVVCEKNDEFSEELFIKPFRSGHVLNYFQFTTVLNYSTPANDFLDSEHERTPHVDSASDRPPVDSTFTHYRYWPMSLGDVLLKYQVQELHLSLTQGLWRHDKWEYPPESSPPGAELWVWFYPVVTDVDKTWSELVEALSGLFCSSLNFMDSKSTLSPQWSFQRSGLAPNNSSQGLLRYSALPREVVCTENLTPWKKLLPCGSKTGLASLFNSMKLYDGNYHSLGIHVRPICRNRLCVSEALELKQTLTFVYDPTLRSRGYQTWDFTSVYGRPLSSRCPLASNSKVYVDVSTRTKSHEKSLHSQEDSTFELTPQPNIIEEFTVGSDVRKYAVYDIELFVEGRKGLNIIASYSHKLEYSPSLLPPVHVQRYTTGYGLEKGGITSLIHNTLDTNLTIVYMESVPWFLRVYFNSLLIQTDDKTVEPVKIHYVPGRDRKQPYKLELVLTLPPMSVTKISFQFERAFLKWTEYPPDANHGFYVNSAVLTTVLPVAYQYNTVPQVASLFGESLKDESTEFFLRLHTETLLVSLPTPDFSMPYNVICLACTVVAIAFGSLHNLTTRRFKVVNPNEKKKGILQKIKAFFKKSNSEKEPVEKSKDNTKEDETETGGSGDSFQVEEKQKEKIDDS